jgi:hypothetical protein
MSTPSLRVHDSIPFVVPMCFRMDNAAEQGREEQNANDSKPALIFCEGRHVSRKFGDNPNVILFDVPAKPEN